MFQVAAPPPFQLPWRPSRRLLAFGNDHGSSITDIHNFLDRSLNRGRLASLAESTGHKAPHRRWKTKVEEGVCGNSARFFQIASHSL